MSLHVRITVTVAGTADGLVPETVTRIEGIVLRIAVYLMLVGAVWALCWWAGYYLVKTRGQRRYSSSPH